MNRILVCTLFLLFLAAGCNKSMYDLISSPASSARITSFSLAGNAGIIDMKNQLIQVTVPWGTSTSSLVATFAIKGIKATVNGVDQISGTTANDFSGSLDYVVTDADNSYIEYTVSVKVAGNADLSNLTMSAGMLSPVFDPAVISYSAAVPYSTASLSVTPSATDPSASIKVNGASVASGSSSSALPLAAGVVTDITITVTASDSTVKIYTVSVTRAAGSANADLSSLTISAGSLSPAFSSSTTAYTVSAAYAITSVTVTPTVADALSTLTVNGTAVPSGSASSAIALAPGAVTSITVAVTAQDLSLKNYTIAVARDPSTDNNLSSLTISDGTLNPAFSPSTASYTVTVAYAIVSMTVTPTAADALSTLTVNGTAATSGSASSAISLAPGAVTSITVAVTAQDLSVKNYTIAVTRSPSSNNNLSALTISSGSLTPSFNPATTSYTQSVPSEITSATVTPTAADVLSSIKVNSVSVASGAASGSISLASSTTITIAVTAQDSSVKNYTIAVTQTAKSSNADLSNIVISSGTLSPAFTSNTLRYSSDLANAVTSITVTPTAAVGTASITVNGVTVLSGAASGPITLSVGMNSLIITVTAEDTSYVKYYDLELLRVPAQSKNAFLSSLTASQGSLSPVFMETTAQYSAQVDQSTVSITVHPVAAGIGSTIKVNGTDVATNTDSNPIALSLGDNIISINVTAGDPSSTMLYTLTVNRPSAPSTNANLANLSSSAGTLSPSFVSSMLNYNLDVKHGVYRLTPTCAGYGATVKVNGVTVVSGAQSGPVNIGAPASIVVTAQDTVTTKTYTITTVQDTTDPVPTGSITAVPDRNYIQLSWAPATDNQTSQPNIRYAVFRSLSNNIGTVNNAQSNGTLLKTLTPAVTRFVASGLTADTMYYFAVVIADDSGNYSIYPVCSAKTLSGFSAAAFNGSVNCLAADGTNIYIGGDFTRIGISSLNNAILDSGGLMVTGSSLFTDGEVRCSISDGEGGFYIGGTFTTVCGQQRNLIAHVLSDGSIAECNPDLIGTRVNAIALSGTTLYIGGVFTSVKGTARSNAASIDITTGTVGTWIPDANGEVFSLALDGTYVYMGGAFTTVSGTARSKIARCSKTTNALSAWNPGSGAVITAVRSIAVYGSTVYAGGIFSSIGGQTRSNLAALDAALDLNNAKTWNPGSDGAVYALAVNTAGSTVYAGGVFSTIGGASRNKIAALDASTGNASAWNPGSGGTVAGINALAVSDDGTAIYAAGDFTAIGGSERYNAAAFDTSGTLLSWDPSMGGIVRTLSTSGTNIYAGGLFTIVNTKPRNHLAALPFAGGVSSWNPDVTGTINALAVYGTTVYAGGSFTSIGMTARNNIAAVDAAGSTTNWNPDADGTINALAVSIDGLTVYAGGSFANIGGQPRTCLAALASGTDTNNATLWNPSSGGTVTAVNAITVNGSIVYIGGSFTSIGGQTRSNIAALDASINTGNATAWDPDAGSQVRTLTLNGTTVYAGGDFLTMSGSARNHLAAISTVTGLTSWHPDADGIVYAVASSGSAVFAGGSFSTAGGTAQNYFAALNPASNGPLSWIPGANDYPKAFLISGSTLYVGGRGTVLRGVYRPFFAAVDMTTGEVK